MLNAYISINKVLWAGFALLILFIIFALNNSNYMIKKILNLEMLNAIKIEKTDFSAFSNSVIICEFTFIEKISMEEFEKKFRFGIDFQNQDGQVLDQTFLNEYFSFLGHEPLMPSGLIFDKYKVKKSYIDTSRMSESGSGTAAYYFIDFKLQGGVIVTQNGPR